MHASVIARVTTAKIVPAPTSSKNHASLLACMLPCMRIRMYVRMYACEQFSCQPRQATTMPAAPCLRNNRRLLIYIYTMYIY